ncbi:hypothetical protein Zmor_027807 [Zophobas morio]|uniref:AAA+ ATPase domain-containing protein n=1 Tax=Zophobas morio TaxID=2755281 RepID=A0AA38HNT8_9CUCU|nr:hypothetical protein Zmor_027807 [Zophobas morio]
MADLKDQSSVAAADYYQVIVDNVKLGMTHGFAVGILILVGLGIKIKFFGAKNKQKNKAKALLSSLGLQSVIPTLNDYELSIASQLVKPSDIHVTFKDVAGLDATVATIKSNIIFPLLTYRFLKNKSRHFAPPKGVLLYGPPGCGKTLLAKATAKEANARFLNLEIPTLTDKWYGESQKFALAVFTLAQKIQPCIIFIDEIDTFLRARGTSDHEVTAMVKAQFMMLWDGLLSEEDGGVIVMGATNRPFDVDEAILRRMPTKLEVSKPDFAKRKAILELFLDGEVLVDVDLDKLAERTDGSSGSDLKELCRRGVSAPIREAEGTVLGFVEKGDEEGLEEFLGSLRRVEFDDFETALKSMENDNKWRSEHEHSHDH